MYVRRYCDCEKIDFKILADLHVLGSPEYENVVFRMSSGCVCVCVCMYEPC
jgi:hypothetical protein